MSQRKVEVQGRTLTINVHPAYMGYYATEDNYDGPEDAYRSAWGNTEEEAVADLLEKMEEFIDLYPDYLLK